MTAKCANSACGTPFIYLRGGQLFLVDFVAAQSKSGPASPTRAPEYFWLCSDCSRTMHVTSDQTGAVLVEPKRQKHKSPVRSRSCRPTNSPSNLNRGLKRQGR